MFQELEIQGYRGFERFALKDLGRINLLVGANNSGKTSVLEAVELLADRIGPVTLAQCLERRAEVFPDDFDDRHTTEFDPSHLFHGHSLKRDDEIVLSGRYSDQQTKSSCTVVDLYDADIDADDRSDVPEAIIGLRVIADDVSLGTLPLTRRGGLTEREALRVLRRWGQTARNGRTATSSSTITADVEFVSTNSLTQERAAELWTEVALGPEEGYAVEALRVIDTNIERVAYLANQSRSRHGGFVVKLAGSKNRIPLGSMGDGVWRLLALALAAVSVRDGVLLVDEIDTGLHHTAMADMWRLLAKICEEHNVQVFATTHSNDCVYALASIVGGAAPSVKPTIHRIEAGATESRVFSEEEIEVVAQQGIEIR